MWDSGLEPRSPSCSICASYPLVASLGPNEAAYHWGGAWCSSGLGTYGTGLWRLLSQRLWLQRGPLLLQREGGGLGTARREDSEAPSAHLVRQLTCNSTGDNANARTNARTHAGTHTGTHANTGP